MNRPRLSVRAVAMLAPFATTAPPALAQSLFQQPVAAPAARGVGAPQSAAADQVPDGAQTLPQGPPDAGAIRAPVLSAAEPLSIEAVSLMAVKPSKPREYAQNDIIQIIISERSQVDRSQETDHKKDYDNSFEFTKFMDLIALLETRIQQTSTAKLPALDVSSGTQFKGDAEYKRDDRYTDRLAARVLEVKPNGTLVLEARRQFVTDEEETVVVLSGVCRYEDVTVNNSVQSNQLFDLSMNVQNSGDLKRTNRKGLIPRVLEGLLNF